MRGRDAASCRSRSPRSSHPEAPTPLPTGFWRSWSAGARPAPTRRRFRDRRRDRHRDRARPPRVHSGATHALRGAVAGASDRHLRPNARLCDGQRCGRSLGGDRLRFRLEVGPGSSVSVRSVAAAMAQPGPRGEASELAVTSWSATTQRSIGIHSRRSVWWAAITAYRCEFRRRARRLSACARVCRSAAKASSPDGSPCMNAS